MRIPRLTPLVSNVWAWVSRENSTSSPLTENQDEVRTLETVCNPNSDNGAISYLKNLTKSRELLLSSGVSREKLTDEHTNIFSNARAVFRERDWSIGSTAKYAARLINMGASPEQLGEYLDGVIYSNDSYDEENRSKVSLSLFFDFVDLLKSNIKQEEWEFYKNIGEPVDNVSFDFIRLREIKLNNNGWKCYKDLVQACELKGEELHSPTILFRKVLKGKPSLKELELYKDAVVYYIENDKDITKLTEDFIALIKSKPSPEQLQVIEDGINKHKENKLELDAFIEHCPKLIETGSVGALKIFSYAALYHAKKKNKVNGFVSFTYNFLRLFRTKPSGEEWKTYIKLLAYHKKDKIEFNRLTQAFSNLVLAKPTTEEWQLLQDMLLYQKNKALPVSDLIDNFSQIIESKKVNLLPEEWDLYKDALTLFKEKKARIDGITSDVGELANAYKASPELLKAYIKTAVYFLNKHISYKMMGGILRYPLINYFQDLTNQKASPTLLRNYNAALSNGKIKSPADSVDLLTRIVIHAGISNLVRENPKGVTKRAQKIILNYAESDSVPYPIYKSNNKINPDAQKVADETLDVYSTAFNIFHGFSSLTFETKRPPTKEPPLIARFGNDVAESVQYVNAKDITLFPGRGFLISKLIPEKIFVNDKEAVEKGQEPFHKYKTAWPWTKDIFDDLKNVEILAIRGMIAISCEGDKYKLVDRKVKSDFIDNLTGRKDRKINYSYVVFNDHHRNYNLDVAYLVPTEVLKKRLAGTLIPYDHYTGPSNQYKDINEVGLTIKDLIKDAEEIDASVLNMGWGSNIGGGLCNSYPPNSSPFHEWERKLRRKSPTEDFYNHVHKSYITGEYVSEMTRKQNKKLLPLRFAHDQVNTLGKRYKALFNLSYRLSSALWHKGETVSEALVPPDVSDDLLFEREYLKEPEQVLERGEAIDDLVTNQASLRMLVEVYKWNKGREQGNNNKNDFPILVLADAFDWWTKPDSPFYLDTFDMTLTIDGKKIQLPLDSNGFGKDEATVWYKKIIPLSQNPAKDFRFYHREDLGLS
ncbi:MAG: hypothetical protein HY094_10430 [Candidatus Melainabacteria bacterium]|nr:hypothetical protein [Candidatus Melainabacteria bacterium]